MGSDDLFKKRRVERKKRKHDFKQPKANSFLIVTEGKRTEPLYFEGIKKKIQEKIGGTINVVEVPTVDIHGKGAGTGRLVEYADDVVKNAKMIYQNVWVVFDKDDFDDFDEAINEANKKGYKVAWSNQSFEYWIYLHFRYSDTALHRADWNEKLNKIFSDNGLGQGKYKKNYENIYALVNTYGDVNAAIKNAKRRMNTFEKSDILPSKYDPGTTVYKLVEELLEYLK